MPSQYDPRDLLVSLTHASPTLPGGRTGRTVDLNIERACDGLPLVQITMTPDQFAAVMGSQVTTLRSDVVLRALPTAEQMTKTAATWWRPGDRVHPRSGGQVVTVAEVQPIPGSLFRQQFRAHVTRVRPAGVARGAAQRFGEGETTLTEWRHSDEYQLATPPQPGEDSDSVRNAARVADLWRTDSDPIIARLVEQIDVLVADARKAAAQEASDVAGRLIGQIDR